MTITRPAKYVAFRIVFEEEPDELSSVLVQRNEMDPIRGEYVRTGENELRIRRHEGLTVCEFIDFYPPLYSQYVLKWRHVY